jgi:hypothetical protein
MNGIDRIQFLDLARQRQTEVAAAAHAASRDRYNRLFSQLAPKLRRSWRLGWPIGAGHGISRN